MKKLRILDQKNYTDDMPIIERYSVRGIIVRDGRIAMQQGGEGQYKILGGGMDVGETIEQTLIREVREESGLIVIPDSIIEIGEIEEKRQDRFEHEKIYHCHSLFFFCDAREEMTETSMTLSEMEKGFHLEWATPEEIISGNQRFVDQPWIDRDTVFVRMLFEGQFESIKHIDWK